MPVEHDHVFGKPRAGMAAEKMIVVFAELARAILMANIVVIRLGQRTMHHGKDQGKDPGQAVATMV